jgi:hypothetical protein
LYRLVVLGFQRFQRFQRFEGSRVQGFKVQRFKGSKVLKVRGVRQSHPRRNLEPLNP